MSFWILVVDFIIFTWIGSQHAVEPFILIGQIASLIYFAWFLELTPLVGLIENTLLDISLNSDKRVKL